MIALVLCMLIGVLAAAPAGAADRDTVAAARALYNEGNYDAAIEAATLARRRPDQADAAALVLARARLERFRERQDDVDLTEGRAALHAVDPDALSSRDRREYLVGLAELQYFDGRFGPAAELFNSALEPIAGGPTGAADAEPAAGDSAQARERLLDWWATALDRRARENPARQDAYTRILERMETELRLDPTSAVAPYWIVAAARGAGDLARAWDAAVAAWVRAPLAGDRADRLRADLDRFVRDLLIPELARSAAGRGERDADRLQAEWAEVTGGWTPP